MNTDDTRFDLLADDELSEEDRRELLASLDDQPDGWRRCALAFLESQCWKKTFGEIRGEPRAAARPEAKPIPPASRPSSWTGRFGTILAMAASFLAAMWLGSVAQHAWTGRSSVPAVGGSDIVKTIGVPTLPFVQPEQQTQADLAQNDEPTPYSLVRLSTPSDGRTPGKSFDLPAVERDKLDNQWAQSVPPAMPDNVKEAFQRLGHQVDQERNLVPVPLGGGRQVVVPVDKVNVHYVGNKVY